MDFILECASISVMILLSMICIIALMINGIRLENRALAEAEKKKSGPWTWD